MSLSDDHLAQLSEAKRLLENPGLAVKLTNLVGKPIEKGFELLPDSWGQRIGVATKDALMFAMKGALLTMDSQSSEAYPRWHKVAASLSGAAGGAFGLPALIAELLLSTTIMCRSIADIARANGESLDSPSARLACIEVFALRVQISCRNNQHPCRLGGLNAIGRVFNDNTRTGMQTRFLQGQLINLRVWFLSPNGISGEHKFKVNLRQHDADDRVHRSLIGCCANTQH